MEKKGERALGMSEQKSFIGRFDSVSATKTQLGNKNNFADACNGVCRGIAKGDGRRAC